MARNAALLLLAVGAAASPAAERDGGKITLENFGRAAHEWQELNDPVMGGQSVATFGIAGGVGVFNGTCAIVPSLSAPGFCSAQTKQKLFGDSWPDASAALAGGLVLVARSLTPSFAGFKVAFGAKDVPSASRYTPQGTFKAPFNVTGFAGEEGFEEIYVPFSSFSWDWSPFTGFSQRRMHARAHARARHAPRATPHHPRTGRCDTKDPTGAQHHCCADGDKYCPTAAYLKTLTSLELWAEGAEGNFHLEVKSIAASADA